MCPRPQTPGRPRQAMPTIIVHGGAWAIPDDQEAAHLDGVRKAARAGWRVLSAGGSALDAAEAAVLVLEDDPTFDAGTGSVLNARGDVEMDAILCDGATGRFGAVCALRNTRHPVSVARAVMERTPHRMLVGSGADTFARECGFAFVPTRELATNAAADEARRMKNQYRTAVDTNFNKKSAVDLNKKAGHDTVGCVALDAKGSLAVATSTGGITAKRPGRVGDSPIFGSGAYVESGVAGVSTTGHGESIMSSLLAADTVWRIGRGGVPPKAALVGALNKMLKTTQGRGGAIMIDATSGRAYHAFTTSKMAWASVSAKGTLSSGIGGSARSSL